MVGEKAPSEQRAMVLIAGHLQVARLLRQDRAPSGAPAPANGRTSFEELHSASVIERGFTTFLVCRTLVGAPRDSNARPAMFVSQSDLNAWLLARKNTGRREAKGQSYLLPVQLPSERDQSIDVAWLQLVALLIVYAGCRARLVMPTPPRVDVGSARQRL